MALSCSKKAVYIKHHGDFYCLNCLHSFRTEDKLKSQEKICKNKDLGGIVVASKKDNILVFNQYMKSDKMPYIIYANIEYLIRKIDGCTNNPEKSSTAKIGEHIPCGNSISTISGFDSIENKHISYRGKDYVKKFCTCLRKHAKNIIDFEKKEMMPLTKEELKSYQDANVCYVCGKRISRKPFKSINYQKVIGHCNYAGKYRASAHSISSLKFNVSNEIPVVFHNGSNYDYHFMIKKLANEFEGQFEFLGDNKEKYKTEVTKMEMNMLLLYLTK